MTTIRRGNIEYIVNFYTERGNNLQLLECACVYDKNCDFSINKCSNSYDTSIYLAINDYEYCNNKFT